MAWDRTHGTVRGAYLKAGNTELYVRQAKDNPESWLLYVDGQLEGIAAGERTAKTAAELAVRCMVAANAAGNTAAA